MKWRFMISEEAVIIGVNSSLKRSGSCCIERRMLGWHSGNQRGKMGKEEERMRNRYLRGRQPVKRGDLVKELCLELD